MDDLYDFVAYKDTLNIYPPQGKVIFHRCQPLCPFWVEIVYLGHRVSMGLAIRGRGVGYPGYSRVFKGVYRQYASYWNDF